MKEGEKEGKKGRQKRKEVQRKRKYRKKEEGEKREKSEKERRLVIGREKMNKEGDVESTLWMFSSAASCRRGLS